MVSVKASQPVFWDSRSGGAVFGGPGSVVGFDFAGGGGGASFVIALGSGVNGGGAFVLEFAEHANVTSFAFAFAGGDLAGSFGFAGGG